MKTTIIGSGIAGISAAIRLAVQGHRVIVYEANDYPGGKLTAFEQDGYRFDAGPSLFTLPYLVDELFVLAGKDPRDHFNYYENDRTCHYFFEDGTFLQAFVDKARLKEEIDAKLGGYGQSVIDYLKESERMYHITSSIFLEKSLHLWKNYFSRDVIKALLKAHTLHLTKTMNAVNAKKFGDDRLVQLFNRYATYNGSSPYLAPGVMTQIPHLEFNMGTFFPKGGMHTITTSLVQLAESVGVQFEYFSRVDKIQVEHQKVTGIRINNQFIPTDVAISNMDIVPTYQQLLTDLKQPSQVLNQERSSSALIFYWGMDKTYDKLDLHNIFFSRNYEAEFDHIFKKRILYDDPTVYVHISSKLCLEDAPSGKENWFVMINAPYNVGQDWDEYIQRARESIIEKLTRMLGENIEHAIVNESILDPRLIETRTSSARGSLYGASSNHWLSAFIRHPNFHREIEGLYFCGGSVHPGGGIPLSILSGQIVSDLIGKHE